MRNRTSSGARSAILGGTALVMLAALSAGCTTGPGGTESTSLLAYSATERHPILMSSEPEVLDIHVGMRGPALSREIEAAVRDYVRSYKETGTGGITIQVPTGAANDVAVASTGHAVHYALVRAGVPRGHITVAPYEVGNPAKPGTLRLSFLRVKATTPSCGIWPDGGLPDFDNTQYDNFGCATQQNLAAMIANPADLVRPTPMTPPSGARRSSVVGTYKEVGNTGWQPEPAASLRIQSLGGN